MERKGEKGGEGEGALPLLHPNSHIPFSKSRICVWRACACAPVRLCVRVLYATQYYKPDIWWRTVF